MSERQETIERNLWAAPALFVFAAWIIFKTDGGSSVSTAGWIVYAAGWIPALVMLVRSVTQGRNPGIGAAVAYGILILMGILFWGNHA
ncbi:hypothetical protein ACIRPP_21920 [Streptomyces sp. NPDC101219]|uniref:hypothetical protein n=1 Tax=Streptomyces sp. NPDC101219 TaxID=3366131 RepID=UPI0038284B3E